MRHGPPRKGAEPHLPGRIMTQDTRGRLRAVFRKNNSTQSGTTMAFYKPAVLCLSTTRLQRCRNVVYHAQTYIRESSLRHKLHESRSRRVRQGLVLTETSRESVTKAFRRRLGPMHVMSSSNRVSSGLIPTSGYSSAGAPPVPARINAVRATRAAGLTSIRAAGTAAPSWMRGSSVRVCCGVRRRILACARARPGGVGLACIAQTCAW